MIYISCPAQKFTGGPTLAHQLCKILNENSIDAKMFYYGRKKTLKHPVHDRYKSYSNPFVTSVDDSNENTIIFLEANTRSIGKYSKVKKIIWWMSVDFYYYNLLTFPERVMEHISDYKPDYQTQVKKYANYTTKLLSDRNIKHFVQSEYARIFLKSFNVPDEDIFELSDFIEDDIIQAGLRNHESKENVVLYNPAKGYEFTSKIIAAAPNINFIPLVNLSKAQMIEKLCTSKVYIDFGNHPGKDRIPREAAICGCIVITGKRGAAKNPIDIPISDDYKFEDIDENIPKIVGKIEDCFNNYDLRKIDFADYIQKIKEEKDQFTKNAITLL